MELTWKIGLQALNVFVFVIVSVFVIVFTVASFKMCDCTTRKNHWIIDGTYLKDRLAISQSLCLCNCLCLCNRHYGCISNSFNMYDCTTKKDQWKIDGTNAKDWLASSRCAAWYLSMEVKPSQLQQHDTCQLKWNYCCMTFINSSCEWLATVYPFQYC